MGGAFEICHLHNECLTFDLIGGFPADILQKNIDWKR